MKRGLKYILLIITVFSFERGFSQSLITAKFVQRDSICDGTKGVIKLAMRSNNKEEEVACFRLMFEYDATLLKIENITTAVTDFKSSDISYPALGQCMITDSLHNPINFWVNEDDETALFFEISFTGNKQGVGQIRFVSDSCYFRTEGETDIAAFYQDSPDINVHSGFIEMTLQQITKGCLYEDKGQAEVKILEGVSPYKYEWTAGIPYHFSEYPNRRDSLPGGEVSIRITDGNGCLHDTTMMIETLRTPKIDWTYETRYSEKSEFAVKEHPIRFYVKENKDGDGENWEWKMYYTDPDTNIRDSLNLGDRKNKEDFDYIFSIDNDYEVQLSAQSRTTGCDTTVIKTVTVAPAELTFNNVVTPGSNRFKITANKEKLRDVFVSHSLIIQDRTGRKVYDTKDFPDDGWDGGGCPNGTYYFILKAKSTKKEYKYQGTVVILGGNK